MADRDKSTVDATQNPKPAKPPAPVIPIDDGREKTWRDKLLCTKAGVPLPNLFNVLLALREAEVWRGTLQYDASALITFVHKPTPWDRRLLKDEKPTIRPWTDHDCTKLSEWLQRNGINVSSSIAAEAAKASSKERQYHPIQNYLRGLDWDKTPRLGQWLHTYMGVEQTLYSEAVGIRWMVSAVRRALEPGCQADHVLVFQGPQGLGKSTALRALAGSTWFSDEVRDFGNKDTSMLLCGRWIIELAELEGMNDASNQRCKAFITRTIDQFRPPYGRHTEDHKRQCVFAATTNQDAFLRDETGNRRYWPVTCTRADTDRLKLDRDHLWAEAKSFYDRGQVCYLDTPQLKALADAEQDERFEVDPWEKAIAKFVKGLKEITPEELLTGTLGISEGGVRKIDRNRASSVLRHLGWERVRIWAKGDRYGEYIWKPKATLQAP